MTTSKPVDYLTVVARKWVEEFEKAPLAPTRAAKLRATYLMEELEQQYPNMSHPERQEKLREVFGTVCPGNDTPCHVFTLWGK